MTYELDGAVVVGRFQLPHKSHLHLVRTALDKAKTVVVVLGSAFHSRNIKNPFTWEEREEMIRLCLSEDQNKRIHFVPVRDYGDNIKWVSVVKSKVDAIIDSRIDNVGLVGFYKDKTSFYLNILPWNMHDAGSPVDIDATSLRTMLFESEDIDITLKAMRPYVSDQVLSYLRAWSVLPHLSRLVEEHNKIKREQKEYGGKFGLAGDFILHYNDYVLLVRRGRAPGKGCYAIPGGMYEPGETLLQTALREAQEETQHDVWIPSLMQNLKDQKFFDNPGRSVRKNIMSMMFYFRMTSRELPHIKGSVDPGESTSEWVHVSKLAEMEDQFFDDHFQALHYFIKFDVKD